MTRDQLRLALELDRRVAAAGALETIAIPGGQVLLNAALAEVRFLNALVLDAPLTIDARELTALADAWLGHLPHRFVRVDDEAGGERLADAQMTMLAHTESRTFGAGEDGGLQSMCELYLDPDVSGVRMAMVEQVGTLSAYRERGLAKATVTAAMRAAGDWGAELLTVPADLDDWPQIIYAGLGFVRAGIQIHFTHRDPSALRALS